MKRTIVYALLLIMMPLDVLAAEQAPERPHWSLELKGGVFIPAIDNWATFYGRRDTTEFGGSFAYKLIEQLEFGIEGTYISDEGKGSAPIHGTVAGDVAYKLAPLNVFLLARARFHDDQWLIPYAGGGWTRMYYKEEVQYQATVRGSTDGYHWRAGLQFVLDGGDPRAASNLHQEYGIMHSSVFIETRVIRATINDLTGKSVDLGGTSWLAGLLFEF